VLLLKPYLLEIQGHTEHTMFPFKLIIATIAAFSTIAQSQQFLIQNWGNGERATNYTYKSLEAGRFTVDWILGGGGNFVVGKGYRGSPSLYV
jgi:endo-1,4-beta-xylanase